MWLWVSQTMSYRFPSKSRQSSRQGELRHKAQLAPVCSLCVLLYEMKIFSGSVLCTVMVTELTCEHLGGDAGAECTASPCELVLRGVLRKASRRLVHRGGGGRDVSLMFRVL